MTTRCWMAESSNGSRNDSDDPLDLGKAPADNKNDKTPKLGIDLGAMLEPLSEQEAAELKAAATEVINDAIAEGIDEIDKLCDRMKKEFEKQRKAVALKSEPDRSPVHTADKGSVT